MHENRTYYLTAFAVSILSFIFYLLTLAPTVYFIDSGELSAVASTLGIAHPTGYPLFTIIGHLFTLLPLSGSEVYKLNLMSAVFCTAALFIFFLLLGYLSKQYEPVYKKTAKKSEQQKTDFMNIETDKFIIILLALFAAFSLAFSKTFWAMANSVEVYPIHAFFICTLLFVFLKALEQKNKNKGADFLQSNSYFILFAFLTGLSFTNHLTTILLAPACIVLFVLYTYKDKKVIGKLLVVMVAAFIAGFSLYLYLPIRANMQPDFNWGNPYNFERMMWHISGKQFSVWIFSSKGSLPLFLVQILILIGFSVYGFINRYKLSKYYHLGIFAGFFIVSFLILSNSSDIVQTQYNRFLNSIVSEFGPGLFIFAFFGILRLVRFNLTIFYFTVLLFFSCLLYAVNYDIHDIDSYFILCYITVAIWMFFGAIHIFEQFQVYMKGSSKYIIAVVILLLSVIPLISNYEFNDESNNYAVEEYTMNVFKNIEPNGIIISTQWDFWLSASWYYNIVKNIRKDIVVIDKELLRRSWYFKYLYRHYPEVYERSRTEIERFLPELDKFEHDLPYDQRVINKLYLDMITSFVEKNTDRSVYTTWEIEQNQQEQFAQGFTRIPDGLLFRLVKSDPQSVKNETIKIYDFQFTPLKNESYYHGTIIQTYNMMLTNSAFFLIQQNRIDDAKRYIELALKAQPDSQKTLELKKKFNL